MQESVILLHGITRTRHSMAALEARLSEAGYRVLNVDYPSRHHRIEELAEKIHPQIDDFLKDAHGPVHFVGHSMGGLVIRAYVHRHPPAQLGRIVMIGTPNRGSDMADVMKDVPFFKAIFGPAGEQLCTHVEREPLPDTAIGVIMGNLSMNPISPFVFGISNDGLVSAINAEPEVPHSKITVPAFHSLMPFSGQVQSQVLNFLKDGAFR